MVLTITVVSGFIACNDDDGESKNAIEGSYFTIEDASFVDAALPSGSEDILTSLSVNRNVINGGSAIVTLVSDEPLKNANIGVKGVKGYYKYELTADATPKNSSTSGYEYEVVINVIQNIKVEDFVLNLSVETVDGVVSSATNSEVINVVEVGTGQLQVSLSWDQFDDVDLHVFTPDGRHIYYGDRYYLDENINEAEFYFNFLIYLVKKYTDNNPKDLDYNNQSDWDLLYTYLDEAEIDDDDVLGKELPEFAEKYKYTVYGFLDIDSNAGCDIDEVNNENIFFPKAIKGTYKVAVNLYSKCLLNANGAKYSVTANNKGQNVKISDKQVGQYASNLYGNYYDEEAEDTAEEYVVIGTFNINEGVDLKTSTYRTKEMPNPQLLKVKKKLFSKK
ncbi:hypothetical protein D0T53_08645 [Dysgonomonas sp. 216]|nr:hypothetical protein [Dysgonomonas sp. 216]